MVKKFLTLDEELAYTLRSRDASKEYSSCKLGRMKNPEKWKEVLRRYRIKHREQGNKYRRTWLRNNRDKVRVWVKNYDSAHREQINIRKRAYRQENISRIRALDKIRYKLETNQLIRPLQCEWCNAQDSKLHYALPDINNLKEVLWLCNNCYWDWRANNARKPFAP